LLVLLLSVVTNEHITAPNHFGAGGMHMTTEGATVEEKAQDMQDGLESKIGSFGKGKYGRILQMAHTPDKEEYLKTSKVSAIGIIILGALGFAIMWIMTYLPDYF